MRHFVAVALLWLLPASTLALEWSARIGLMYDKFDRWPDAGTHIPQSAVNLDLGLDALGSIGSPDVFAWSAGGVYRRYDQRFNGYRSSLTSALAYHLDASLFRHRTSPLTLQVFADRSDSQLQTFSDRTLTGDATAETLGGRLAINPELLPKLDINYQHVRREETLPGLELHRATTDRLQVRYTQSAQNFTSYGDFTGEMSDGTWVYDQSRSYAVTAEAQAIPWDGASFFLTDGYYHREPTSSGAQGAFAQDINAFQGGFRSGTIPGDKLIIRFLNRRGLASTSATASESIYNALEYGQDFRVTSLGDYVQGVASVSRQEVSAGNLLGDSSGATAGADYVRRRTPSPGTTYELGAGPRVAWLHVPGSSEKFGYGAAGRASAMTPWRGYVLNGAYTITYGNSIYGREGWSLDQNFSASISGNAGPGRFSGQIGGLARRAHSPVGEEAVRSLSAIGDFRWDTYSVFANVSYSSGVLPGTPSNFIGDGLFLPIGFQSSSTSVGLGGSVRLFNHLTGAAELRYRSSSGPGQPDIEAAEGIASVSYRYGYFEFAIEDRAQGTGFDLSNLSANLFMIRASRAFGNRF
jgi:hypothetical protein